jgi:hypothetical protein
LFREFSSLQSIRDFQKIKYPHLGLSIVLIILRAGRPRPYDGTIYYRGVPLLFNYQWLNRITYPFSENFFSI